MKILSCCLLLVLWSTLTWSGSGYFDSSGRLTVYVHVSPGTQSSIPSLKQQMPHVSSLVCESTRGCLKNIQVIFVSGSSGLAASDMTFDDVGTTSWVPVPQSNVTIGVPGAHISLKKLDYRADTIAYLLIKYLYSYPGINRNDLQQVCKNQISGQTASPCYVDSDCDQPNGFFCTSSSLKAVDAQTMGRLNSVYGLSAHSDYVNYCSADQASLNYMDFRGPKKLVVVYDRSGTMWDSNAPAIALAQEAFRILPGLVRNDFAMRKDAYVPHWSEPRTSIETKFWPWNKVSGEVNASYSQAEKLLIDLNSNGCIWPSLCTGRGCSLRSCALTQMNEFPEIFLKGECDTTSFQDLSSVLSQYVEPLSRILFVTDGNAFAAVTALSAEQQSLANNWRNRGIMFNVLLLKQNKNFLLEQLASITGGDVVTASNEGEIAPALRKLESQSLSHEEYYSKTQNIVNPNDFEYVVFEKGISGEVVIMASYDGCDGYVNSSVSIFDSNGADITSTTNRYSQPRFDDFRFNASAGTYRVKLQSMGNQHSCSQLQIRGIAPNSRGLFYLSGQVAQLIPANPFSGSATLNVSIRDKGDGSRQEKQLFYDSTSQMFLFTVDAVCDHCYIIEAVSLSVNQSSVLITENFGELGKNVCQSCNLNPATIPTTTLSNCLVNQNNFQSPYCKRLYGSSYSHTATASVFRSNSTVKKASMSSEFPVFSETSGVRAISATVAVLTSLLAVILTVFGEI